MATATNDADDIRLKMAQIRRELHSDVREVVANAEAATDWRRYVKSYPWAALGVSVAVGYLIVPKRRKPQKPVPVSVSIAEVASPKVTSEVTEQETATTKDAGSKGLIGMALGFITPIAMRAAQGYAAQYLETWIAQQQQSVQAMAAGSRSPSSGHPDTSPEAGRFQAKPRPPF